MAAITAYAADGSVHNFPDGTDPAIVDRAMKAYAGQVAAKQPMPVMSAITDMARATPGALAKAGTGLLGLPGSVSDLMSAGADYVGNALIGADVHTPRSPLSGAKLDEYLTKAVTGTPGYYEPKTTPGKYWETGVSFAPAAFGGEASIPARLLGRVAAPAAVSETAGSLPGVKGTAWEGPARLAGALAGGAPAIAKEGARLASQKFLPKMTEALAPEDAALVTASEKLGLPLRPGQYSPSNFVRQGDAVMADTQWPRVAGFERDSAHAITPSQQAEKFNTLLGEQFGQSATRLTDDVVQQAHKDLGKVYDTVLPRNAIRDSTPLKTALDNVDEELARGAPALKPDDWTRISKVMASIRMNVQDGMSGTLYQKLRQRGGLLDEMEGSGSPILSKAAGDVRQALDDAFAAQAGGDDAAMLAKTNQQYRVLKTLKPIIAKAPAGDLTPFSGQILNAVNREYGSPGAAGDLGKLAQIGAAYLKPLANSGTAERSVWRKIINKPFTEGIPAAANAAVAPPFNAITTRQMNKIINSPQMRAKLLASVLENQGATNIPTGPGAQALAKALQQP